MKKTVVLFMTLLVLTACTTGETEKTNQIEVTVEDIETNEVVKALEEQITSLENEVSNLTSQNNLVGFENCKSLEGYDRISEQLEKMKEDLIVLETQNQELTDLNTYYIDMINNLKYEDYDTYIISDIVYTEASSKATIIEGFPSIVFGISESLNDQGEKWLYVEAVYPHKEAMCGYIKYNPDEITFFERNYRSSNQITVDGHYIGESANIFKEYIEEGADLIKGEMNWYLKINDSGIGIDPVNWSVNSFYVSNSEFLLDDKFRVGDNAVEVINYYTEKYPIFYSEKVMNEKPDNWFEIDDEGTILGIIYNTETLTEDSLVGEIKIFNQKDMN